MAGIVNKFIGHVMPGVIRPLRVLWNEVIGFLFWSSPCGGRFSLRQHPPASRPYGQPRPRRLVRFFNGFDGLLRPHILSASP